MAIRRKKAGEYPTGRLNISCAPAMKDAIAEDATAAGKSISQYMLDLYDASTKVGTSEHTARIGLELIGIKKRLVDIETQMRRGLTRSQGAIDPTVAETVLKLRELEKELDDAVRETVEVVKSLKEQGK